MAVADVIAPFAIEVLAARGQTAGATLALSDMHSIAGQQLVALANGITLMIPRTTSSSGQSDPRQKRLCHRPPLANPTAIADKRKWPNRTDRRRHRNGLRPRADQAP